MLQDNKKIWVEIIDTRASHPILSYPIREYKRILAYFKFIFTFCNNLKIIHRKTLEFSFVSRQLCKSSGYISRLEGIFSNLRYQTNLKTQIVSKQY